MKKLHPGGDPPPRPVLLRSIKAGEVGIFTMLGGWDACLLHYKSECYTPCTGFETCPKPTHALKTIWRGYAPAHEWDQVACRWWSVALEVTENLALCMAGRDLRGEIWMIRRTDSTRKTASVSGEYLQTVEFNGAYWFDPRPIVEHRYRVSQIQWGIGLNVQAKLIRPGVEEPPPAALALAHQVGREVPQDAGGPMTEERAELLRKFFPKSFGNGHVKGGAK